MGMRNSDFRWKQFGEKCYYILCYRLNIVSLQIHILKTNIQCDFIRKGDPRHEGGALWIVLVL